jgi:long-chain acyl-CoA synthetase
MTSSFDRPWLSKYPKGVPTEINPNAYKSAVDAFLQSCKKYPELQAFINMGKSISYSEVEKLSRDFAAFLQNTCGLKKGDRIAIQKVPKKVPDSFMPETDG